ncbi:MAG: MBL fold metallo-hydrolase, partial [Promethearchaeota archaeon]
MLPYLEQIYDESPDFLFIRGKEESDYYTCNALLINDILIDTGISNKYLEQIIKNYEINKVIFSHWHEDHISGSNLLPKCSFLCHSNDKFVIENIKKMYLFYGFNVNPPDEMVSYLNKYDLHDTKISQTLKDGQKIVIDDKYNLMIIHTPGHTSGHCCFYEEDLKFAFLADINMPESGPWYGGIDSNLIEYEESLHKLLNLEIETAIFSHYGL